MATMNPFDLLGDNDNDDPSQLLESVSAQLLKPAETVSKKNPTQNLQQKVSKMPSKPLPPQQAVREAKNETARGGGRGSGHRGSRGRGGYSRDYNNENSFNNSRTPGPQGEGKEGRTYERRAYDGPRPQYRGGMAGGDHPRKTYEGHDGIRRGNEFRREGFGHRNWGNQSDEVPPATEEVPEETVKNVSAENPPSGEEAVDRNTEALPAEAEEKEPEEKEMTLEEYQKVLEEKRKALLALKTEERKVEVDKDLQSMQQLSNRKDEDSVFIKLASDKDKKKDGFEKEKAKKASDKDKKKDGFEKEKAKKSVSINEFLKPADGERYYSPGGRGRGRGGHGPRGGGGGGGGGGYGGPSRMTNASAPAIEDQKQFPTLGGAPRA